MPLWKLILSYDGTPFHGWQVQPSLPTVQGTLAGALFHITGEAVLPQGSGRTDAGVHALAQVASVELHTPIPPANLYRALNDYLPPSIRVLSAQLAPPHFHARHSARRKSYEYRIFTSTHYPTQATDTITPPASQNLTPASGTSTQASRYPNPAPDASTQARHYQTPAASSITPALCSPMLAPWVWDIRRPLDFEALQQASRHILGTHDFTSFAAADPDLTTRSSSLTAPSDKATDVPQHATNIRTVDESLWTRQENLLTYRIAGSGFLHHMVRNLVGTFVQCALGRIPPNSIPNILKAQDRSAAGPTAPARGLFLIRVEY